MKRELTGCIAYAEHVIDYAEVCLNFEVINTAECPIRCALGSYQTNTYQPPCPQPRRRLQIDEALPHLLEAVSIDPDNAKYRHTLGMAKHATGDEEGARDHLLEAALLDEEDAEDRYQLRMRRLSAEKRANPEENRSNVRDSKTFAQQVIAVNIAITGGDGIPAYRGYIGTYISSMYRELGLSHQDATIRALIVARPSGWYTRRR